MERKIEHTKEGLGFLPRPHPYPLRKAHICEDQVWGLRSGPSVAQEAKSLCEQKRDSSSHQTWYMTRVERGHWEGCAPGRC